MSRGSLNSQLIVSAFQGNLSEIKKALSRGADVNYETLEGFSALVIASKNGHHKIVKLLIENRADIDALQTGKSALMHAIENGHHKTVKLMLKNGAKVDLLDTLHWKTALMYAINCAQFEVVNMLILQYGAQVDLQDITGKTALIHAIIADCLCN